MSSPKKRFLSLLPTCQPRLLSDGATGEGKSIVAYTSGKRGVVVCSDGSVSTVLGDATGGLGTAGREGTLTSNEHDVRENRAAPISGYCVLPCVDG